jgi:hypothetical protein
VLAIIISAMLGRRQQANGEELGLGTCMERGGAAVFA